MSVSSPETVIAIETAMTKHVIRGVVIAAGPF
jgi:hypothetical protein